MRRATGDGRRATGDGRRATGDGRRATGERTVLAAARSAVGLHRLLDALVVFSGDARISRFFTLVPGSDFSVDTLAAVGAAGARTLPWDEARLRSFDLVLTASPKGEIRLLRGDRVLLPHGAGFGKAIPGEGSPGTASGLDPAFLSPGDEALALYALAHPNQVTELAKVSPLLAERARVVGDPTLERLLVSRSHRERYRAALGTGGRCLVVLASTWGPESLLRRRPDLPADLMARLPHDGYQLALIVHPNERDLLSSYELRERLAPALDAGLVLAEPYEGWAALLVAADVLISDHGSAALYFSAVRDRPVLNAYDGGAELLPGSAVATLLSTVPRLEHPAGVRNSIDAYRPGSGRGAVRTAFAERGRAVRNLRGALYTLLGLTPPEFDVGARSLPPPGPAAREAGAFDVAVEVSGRQVRVDRFPAGLGTAAHHLAAEHGLAGERQVTTAAVLYRRAAPGTSTPYGQAWTADAWTAHALGEYPNCRLAAAVLGNGLCVLRHREDMVPRTVRVEPHSGEGVIVRTDPAAAVSAVHAWYAANRRMPSGTLHCAIGRHVFQVDVTPATHAEGGQAV